MKDTNIIDIIIGIALIFGAIRGFSRGFISQIVGLFGIIVAIFVSLQFYHLIESFLLPLNWISPSFISIVALLVTFGLIYLSIKIVSYVLQKSIETVGLGIFNRIAGAVVGVLIFLLICSSILLIINPILDWIYPEVKEKSLLIEPLSEASEKVKDLWSENKEHLKIPQIEPENETNQNLEE